MRRAAIDLAAVAAIPNLAEATARAARGKRERPAVRAFLADLEGNLCALAAAILDGRVPRGEYRPFRIRDPKPRLIHAACFPDRVLHHAIMRHAGPVFERTMTDTSFACRPGKGTLAAVRAAREGVQRFPWYVKIDIRGYFQHIDHAILLELLARRFKGRPFLDLLGRIIRGPAAIIAPPSGPCICRSPFRATPGPRGGPVALKGDLPLTEARGWEDTPGKGLPIGSLTSQYFANYYLDGLDRFLLEQLRVSAELRYMDDVLWFCTSRDQARETLAAVREWLAAERLLAVKEPPAIQQSARGVGFCGYRIGAGAVRLGARRRRRYAARRRFWEACWRAGIIDAAGLQRGYDAVHAITGHAASRGWRRIDLARHPAPEV